MLATRERGRGHPIVLVHGLGGSARVWGRLVRILESTYQLVSVDLPGHGESPPDESRSISDLADAITLVCRSLGLVEPMIVGHSVGGFIALELGFRRDVSAIVLVDSEAGRETLGWLDELTSPHTAPESRSAALVRRILELDPATQELLARQPDQREAYLAALQHVNPDGYLQLAAAARLRTDRTADLADLSVPALAVVGELDTSFVGPSRKFADATGSMLVTIEGAGHLPMLEAPSDVAAALATFATEKVWPS